MTSGLGLKLLLIPAGWVLGFAAGLAVLGAALVVRAGTGDPAANAAQAFEFGFSVALSDAYRFSGPGLLAATTAAIVLAEGLAIRNWIYFAVASAGAVLGVWQMSASDVAFIPALDAAAAGLAGGLVYWLAAGRLSGFSPRG